MIQRQPLQEEDQASAAWRQDWKTWMQQQAHTQSWQQQPLPLPLPAPLRSVYTQRLRPVSAPVTPLPPTRGSTEPITKLTDMLPIVRLLEPVSVRDTRELVSSAVQWFYEKYGVLPTTILLNPLRCLSIPSQAFFAVDCEDLGSYTVEVQASPHLGCDVVGCRYRDYLAYQEDKEDYYL